MEKKFTEPYETNITGWLEGGTAAREAPHMLTLILYSFKHLLLVTARKDMLNLKNFTFRTRQHFFTSGAAEVAFLKCVSSTKVQKIGNHPITAITLFH